MKFLVTQVEFDIDQEDPDQFGSVVGAIEYTEQLQRELKIQALGIWEVDDEEELVDKISDSLGYCIRFIDYTSDLLHPLTSYL
tara:strand:+ start:374 stop:622 length:249 start_codon:yes stop_codon:yes gene_type:complete